MAYNEATDTLGPNTTSARPTEPVGTLNRPHNKSNENEGKGKKGKKGKNNDGGDKNVRHAYVVPSPTPPASRLPPEHAARGGEGKRPKLDNMLERWAEDGMTGLELNEGAGEDEECKIVLD
ncbi:hypothetical protein PAXINDRAFT_13552 [Paxillus involutus ATCC 200175]|uniref:Unplaced genomic scaffold PAXINscaffold_28, whole genome shotgun sequence n=1 Tax=Paxillus involutus ATCC 200175 TaxID=664439 RepID=A0A0C9U2M5_PAXIN|nr:hypothetical protein PAXINDRAFT_13552 [Paxillus involutus ATCC 200175]